MSEAEPVVDVRRLTKRFGANLALTGADLRIRPGTVHALIGMNGSGKSTLVKLLAGFHEPNSGSIRVASLDGTQNAGEIAFVHQDLGLIPEFTVLENLCLARPLAMRRGMIDWSAERRRAQTALAAFDQQHLVDVQLSRLSRTEATMVAIVRALERQDRCSAVVFDEPTSTLSSSETAQLLDLIRATAREGRGVLLVTHRLKEVMDVADDVTVLRNGKVAFTGEVQGSSVESLASLMVGSERSLVRRLGQQTDDVPRPTGSSSQGRDVVLRARGVSGLTVDRISLEVRRGEIVGIVGLTGSGVEEVGRLLGRRRPLTAGTVEYEVPHEPRVGFIPADRQQESALLDLTTRENVTITHVDRFLRFKRLVLDLRAERRETSRWFARLNVVPCDTEVPMTNLSGGNQQKVVLARWLAVKPDVLIAEEPTQGVDIHAKSDILELLRINAERGLAVVLITGEPDEIVSACDRVLVLRQGRIAADLSGSEQTRTALVEMQ